MGKPSALVGSLIQSLSVFRKRQHNLEMCQIVKKAQYNLKTKNK